MFTHRRNLDVHVAVRAFYGRQHGCKVCIVGHGDSIYAEALSDHNEEIINSLRIQTVTGK